jgi:hypothetical protein
MPEPQAVGAGGSARQPTAGQTLAAMWLYTLLRFALFFALWGLLWLANVPGLLAALIAIVLSVPLSFILLRKQREKMAANLEQRVGARKAKVHELDARLAGQDPGADPDAGAPGESDRPGS